MEGETEGKEGMSGPQDSPYEGGSFRLEMNFPSNYPHAPPNVTFVTPVYHPNIDSGGRICLDLLKQPPTVSRYRSETVKVVTMI